MTRILPSKKITKFGHTFDSKDEYNRYLELRRDEAYGDITDLKVHPNYKLNIYDAKGKKIYCCSYTADFEYVIVKTKERRTEDVKSLSIKRKRMKDGSWKKVRYGTAALRDWKLKQKIFLASEGRPVYEVLMNRSIRGSIERS